MLNKNNRENFLVRHWRWTLLGILLLALTLRLINISAEPYWLDEILSLDISTTFASLREMVRYIADVEFHPPLYYILLYGWTGLFGVSEAATRALSVIFSLVTIALVYVAGVRLFDSRRTGLVAAGVLAVLPIQIEFGQEARPYALFCFCGLLAAIFCWEYLRRPRAATLIGYVLVTLAGLYLHYSYLFIAVAIAGWWLLFVLRAKSDRRLTELKQFLLAQALVFIGFWPWLVPFLYKFFLGSYEIYGVVRSSTAYRTPALVELIFNQLIWLTKLDEIHLLEIVAQFIFLLLLAWGAYVFVRGRRFNQQLKKFAVTYQYLLWLTMVPLLLYVISPQSAPYTTINYRHIIFVTVPLALLLARLLVSIPLRQALVIGAVFAITLLPPTVNVLLNDALWDHYYRLGEDCQFVNEQYRSGDLVIIPTVGSRTDFTHYLSDEIPIEPLLPLSYFGGDMLASRHRLGIAENALQLRQRKFTATEAGDKLAWLMKIHQPQRVWLLGFDSGSMVIYDWFADHGWRSVYTNIANIRRLDMYSKE